MHPFGLVYWGARAPAAFSCPDIAEKRGPGSVLYRRLQRKRVMRFCLLVLTAAALCAKRGELPRELDDHLVQDARQKAGCTLFDQE